MPGATIKVCDCGWLEVQADLVESGPGAFPMLPGDMLPGGEAHAAFTHRQVHTVSSDGTIAENALLHEAAHLLVSGGHSDDWLAKYFDLLRDHSPGFGGMLRLVLDDAAWR